MTTPPLSEVAVAAVAAIARTAAEQVAQVEAYWRAQIPDTEPPPVADDVTTIGMSAEADLWDERLASVGADGVTARRIFAKLTKTGTDQIDLVAEAYAAQMLPVISYKVPNVAAAIRGDYDGWARAAAAELTEFDAPAVVAIWHEPHGDMAPADFVRLQERLGPLFNVGKLVVGPFLNGWLLDNRPEDFWSYTSPTLLQDVWRFVGIDTYQPDDVSNPIIPGDRILELVALLDEEGYPDMPVGVGEYNGFDADAIEQSGEIFLSEPRCRFACMWNSASDPGGLGVPLEGDRLEAFQTTKDDPRARQGWWGRL